MTDPADKKRIDELEKDMLTLIILLKAELPRYSEVLTMLFKRRSK